MFSAYGQDSDYNNLQLFNNPLNMVDSVEYDLDTEMILITNYVGGQLIGLPTYLSRSEYERYVFDQKFYNYWKKNISKSSDDNNLNPSEFGGQIANRIFGSSIIDIKPQGSAELIFSGVVNKIDNPALPEEQRKTTSGA